MKIGLFYGSSTCYTEMAAEKSVRFWVKTVDLHNLKDVSPKLMEDYSILILGIPTGISANCRKTGKRSGRSCRRWI